MSHPAVLVVEDDLPLREALCDTLQLAGFGVLAAPDGKKAMEILADNAVGMVVSDVQMAPMDGYALLQDIKRKWPQLPVVLMTAFGTIEKAVQAMRQGASDYLVKPFEAQALVEKVKNNILLSNVKPNKASFTAGPHVVAVDEVSQQQLQLAKRVASSEVTVMLSGESGTGKEVFAQYMHSQSSRANGPFIAVNCAAIPENMLEATLFGYEKGAFTGAYQACSGKFEQAQGGTLLLDEVSEMDINLQAKLLRVLQEKEVERLGGRKVIALDVRVLATTNRNLREEVAAGNFREDLFYRLNVFPIHLHPLRERKADIIPLAERLLQRHAQHEQVQLSEQASQCLIHHDWPGNVRELDNLLQRALILKAGPIIEKQDVQFEGIESVGASADSQLPSDADNLDDNLKTREQRLIIDALIEGNGSRKNAAERLGISPRTLRYKLAKMREKGIEIPA